MNVISRRQFLARTAAAAAALYGAERIIDVGAGAFAEERPLYSVKTDLAFVNAAALTALFAEIDRFGTDTDHVRAASALFADGMTLDSFATRYCAAARRANPAKPERNGSYRGVAFARHAEAHLALINRLITMLGNAMFEATARAAWNNLSTADERRIGGDIGDILGALRLVAKRMSLPGLDAAALAPNDMDRDRRVTVHATRRYARTYHNIVVPLYHLERCRTDFRSPAFGDHAIGLIDYCAYAVRAARYRWKAIFARYALLESFERDYAAVPNGREAISPSGVIASGKHRLAGKATLAHLYAELSLLRMRVLARQSQSGIFTNEDRQHFMAECSCLVDATADIAARPTFAKRPIFGGSFAVSPSPKAGAKKTARIAIPALTIAALGLADTSGKRSFAISTPQGAGHAVKRIDDALAIVRRDRAKLREALGK
ncbi:MAG TPA: hypothetical protein PLE73_00920 [Spirochaetota bacterium]|nr:hypothetical protein [Spirochaetota bacterium]HOS39365.1 hypothetical protein [Spirochaetota bacterium]HPI21728.1 hypothetical protein [Spirochaetota bacterium]HPU89652.1 hypothetical protein [Spirochaetota bacterium]